MSLLKQRQSTSPVICESDYSHIANSKWDTFELHDSTRHEEVQCLKKKEESEPLPLHTS